MREAADIRTKLRQDRDVADGTSDENFFDLVYPGGPAVGSGVRHALASLEATPPDSLRFGAFRVFQQPKTNQASSRFRL